MGNKPKIQDIEDCQVLSCNLSSTEERVLNDSRHVPRPGLDVALRVHVQSNPGLCVRADADDGVHNFTEGITVHP